MKSSIVRRKFKMKNGLFVLSREQTNTQLGQESYFLLELTNIFGTYD